MGGNNLYNIANLAKLGKIPERLHCYAGDTRYDMTDVEVRIFIVYRLSQPNGAAILHRPGCHGN